MVIDQQALPSPMVRSSQQPGPQAGVSAHCLSSPPSPLPPQTAHCHFPGMTDVTAIQYVQARTKAFSRSTKPAGMQTGQLQWKPPARGPSLPHPQHAHTQFFKPLKPVLTYMLTYSQVNFSLNHWTVFPEHGDCTAISQIVFCRMLISDR